MQKKFILLGLLLCAFNSVLFSQTYSYNFNNTLTGSGGGPALTEILETNGACLGATGGFSNQTINTTSGNCGGAGAVPAFDFVLGGGLSFSNAGSQIGNEYTINVLLKLDVALASYYRVIDFQNGATDNGVYIVDDYIAVYDGGNSPGPPGLLADNYYLFSFVRNNTLKELDIYINGAWAITYPDPTDIFAPATPTTPILFFKDDAAGPCDYGSGNGGSVKYISLKNSTSTAAEILSTWTSICSIVLPLQMLDFSANKQSDNSISLKWVTEREENTSHFELERSTTGGSSFSKIATVATNNVTEKSNYNFTDRQPFSGTNLYRLKIYDADGRFKYSNVLKVNMSGKQLLEIFPNPAKDVITINGVQSNQTVKLFNTEGRQLLQQIATGQTITMDISKFPTGIYFISYFDGDQLQRQKVVKQ